MQGLALFEANTRDDGESPFGEDDDTTLDSSIPGLEDLARQLATDPPTPFDSCHRLRLPSARDSLD
jgi:hypothetical protein